MKNTVLSVALCASLAACGDGNPFGGGGAGGETDPDAVGIPEVLAGDLDGFTYNPATQTLTVRGVSLEDGPFEADYRRRAGMDRGSYQAFTSQDGSLDRHSTAYVKSINGTRAAIVVTGVQFEELFMGGAYSNTQYSPAVVPESQLDGGLVSYAGNYVGMLNGPGSGEDLLPVAPGTPNSFRPVQAAEITGRVLITASFGDSQVDGVVAERRLTDYDATVTFDPNSVNPLVLTDIALDVTGIEADGTFVGKVSQNNEDRGDYGGIFGGFGATEVAGVLRAENHIEQFTNEIEFGVFVLGQCGTPAQDPVCNQPNP